MTLRFADADSSTIPELPDRAFLGPARLENAVILEAAINNPTVVDETDLLAAWNTLSSTSVEATLAGKLDLFDFANDHCILLAAVRQPVRIVLSDIDDVKQLDLPRFTFSWKDYSDTPIFTSNSPHLNDVFGFAHTGERGNGAELAESSAAAPGPNELAVLVWKTIGVVYVTMSPTPREVHIGIALLPAYRGRGAGMKACALATQWAIETISAHRVQARIMSPSVPSSASESPAAAQRLFTALGFAHEGLQRRAVTDANGAWADVTHMGIIDTDWVVRKRTRAAPRSAWDELFARHQREREELLQWEENGRRSGRLWGRSSSVETLRVRPMEPESAMETEGDPFAFSDSSSSCGSDARTRSPSPSPSVASSSARSMLSFGELAELLERSRGGFGAGAGSHWLDFRRPTSEGDASDGELSDSGWVLGGPSNLSRSSEEPVSRPLSAASWSSLDSAVSSGSSSASHSLAHGWVTKRDV